MFYLIILLVFNDPTFTSVDLYIPFPNEQTCKIAQQNVSGAIKNNETRSEQSICISKAQFKELIEGKPV